MFIQPCFIRLTDSKQKDTVIRHLDKLGYRKHFLYLDEEPYIHTWTNSATAPGFSSWTHDLKLYWCSRREEIFDCGDNTDLFCAVIALRDDSSKHQWYTNGYDWYLCKEHSLYLPDSDPDTSMNDIDMSNHFHKATISELLEHFKSEPLDNENNLQKKIVHALFIFLSVLFCFLFIFTCLLMNRVTNEYQEQLDKRDSLIQSILDYEYYR